MNKKIIITAIILITLSAFFFGLKECQPNNRALTKVMKKRPYIDPPFADVSIPLEVYKVNASNGGTLKYGENTIIEIPSNAFIDKNGQIVKGKVKVAYRECNDPISTIISGIPMEIEEGTENYLQSAGMFEMNAWQNKELLYVNPNSKIKVKLRSQYDAEDYNLYNLDTANRKWGETAQNLNVNKIPTPEVETKTRLPKQPKKDFDKIAKSAGFAKPEKPVELNKERFQFRFKTDFSQHPEINIYNGVQWEFAGKKDDEDPTKNPWVLTARWNEMEITRRLSEGRYRLKLRRGDQIFKTTAKPVFDADDMEYAQVVYEEKYEAYRSYVDKKKEEARQESLRQESLAKKREKELAKRNKRSQTYEAFEREVQVAGFGWTNIDKLIIEKWPKMMALFSKKDMNPIQVTKVYLITDGINSVVSYQPNEKNVVNEFRIDINKSNRIMVVDSSSMVYVFKPDYLSKYGQAIRSSKRHNFISRQKGQLVSSEKDIKNLLGIKPQDATI